MKLRHSAPQRILFAIGIALSLAVAAAQNNRPFLVYDNMFYRHQPSTLRDGLVVSNILYENVIWTNKQSDAHVPDRRTFESLVRAHSTNPGPIVIDIESRPLNGPPEVARRNLEILTRLADWAHEAAPGRIIGFYGTNTLSQIDSAHVSLARELARHVDAFFPSAYTFNDDRRAWAKHLEASAAEARTLGPGKPVYCYLWPQYHDGTPKQFQYVNRDYWKFQLETAARSVDGVVLWSPSRFAWDNSTGWWTETRNFIDRLRLSVRQ
jgi:hypothetical protein